MPHLPHIHSKCLGLYRPSLLAFTATPIPFAWNSTHDTRCQSQDEISQLWATIQRKSDGCEQRPLPSIETIGSNRCRLGGGGTATMSGGRAAGVVKRTPPCTFLITCWAFQNSGAGSLSAAYVSQAGHVLLLRELLLLHAVHVSASALPGGVGQVFRLEVRQRLKRLTLSTSRYRACGGCLGPRGLTGQGGERSGMRSVGRKWAGRDGLTGAARRVPLRNVANSSAWSSRVTRAPAAQLGGPRSTKRWRRRRLRVLTPAPAHAPLVLPLCRVVGPPLQAGAALWGVAGSHEVDSSEMRFMGQHQRPQQATALRCASSSQFPCVSQSLSIGPLSSLSVSSSCLSLSLSLGHCPDRYSERLGLVVLSSLRRVFSLSHGRARSKAAMSHPVMLGSSVCEPWSQCPPCLGKFLSAMPPSSK